MDLEINNLKKQNELLDTLYKKQFRLKLGVVYLFATKFNIILLILGLLLYKNGYYGLDTITSFYILIMIVYYKFFFNATKDGYYYRIFVFKIYSDFKSKIAREWRKILKENSANKIKVIK